MAEAAQRLLWDHQSRLSEIETWPIDERSRLVQDVWDRLVETGTSVSE